MQLLVKRGPLSSLWPAFMYRTTVMRSSLSHLFSKEKILNSFSLSSKGRFSSPLILYKVCVGLLWHSWYLLTFIFIYNKPWAFGINCSQLQCLIPAGLGPPVKPWGCEMKLLAIEVGCYTGNKERTSITLFYWDVLSLCSLPVMFAVFFSPFYPSLFNLIANCFKVFFFPPPEALWHGFMLSLASRTSLETFHSFPSSPFSDVFKVKGEWTTNSFGVLLVCGGLSDCQSFTYSLSQYLQDLRFLSLQKTPN